MSSHGKAGMILTLGLALATSAVAEPGLDASLRDADKLAQKGSATVEVRASGIELVDPASVQEQPHDGEGHLHYRVDEGPVIATTAPKLSFHELAPGLHRIEVSLVGNDHQPLGPTETLSVRVPADMKEH
jgi:hypothetical protein